MDDRQHLLIVAGLMPTPGVVASTISFGDHILVWVAEKGEVLLNGDISQDNRFRNLVAHSATDLPSRPN